jgi:riboflavin transporter FmnP
MELNMNQFSGILMGYCLGAATSMFVGSFLLKGHYHILAGSIFDIVGSSLLIVAVLSVLINAQVTKKGKESPSSETINQFVTGFFILTIITLVVMLILGETVRFWDE